MVNQAKLRMITTVMKRYDLKVYQVFVLAFAYAKSNAHQKDMDSFIKKFCRQNREGEYILYDFPMEVEDYLIDILAGIHKPAIKG